MERLAIRDEENVLLDTDMFSSLKEKSLVAILMQRVPDPDGIGASLGLSWFLAKTKQATCDIIHEGIVSHPQTRAMLNVLGIQLHMKEKSELSNTDYEAFIVVDSVLSNTGFDVEIHYAIDHHKETYPDDVESFNKPVGSCCSLIYQLIRDNKMDLDDSIIATAMFVGLYTDTDGLRSTNTDKLDFEAFKYLSIRAEDSKLKQIFNYPMPAPQFDLEARAINSRMVEESKLVTCLGEISPGHRDVMPVVADRLVRMQGIDTVVVFAFVDDFVDASIRSTDTTLDVDAFCKDIFGEAFNGSAGSKNGGIGGGRAPLGISITSEDDKQDRSDALEKFEARLKKRVLKRLGQ